MNKSNQLERIASLDVIRGIAILGILLMNIQSFSMIGQAYLNPMAYGDMQGANRWIWILSHLFADQKFMTIFSMLFGASTLLIIEKTKAKGSSQLKAHYSRNFWLLLIGLFHAYVLWFGDILVPYALCAFLVFPFRNLSVKKLLIFGLLIFSISSVFNLLTGWGLPHFPEADYNDIKSSWLPSAESANAEIAAYLGSFSEQMAQRGKSAYMMQTLVFFTTFLWRVLGLMLIGMALFKSGFLQGYFPAGFYRKYLIGCGVVGFGLVIFGMIQNFQAGFSFEYSMFQGAQFNYWGSLLVAVAYICGIILLLQSKALSAFTECMAWVGKMALSNYLLQTLICTFIFYGLGLGLFGSVERWQQLLIVVGVWAIQVIISPIWMQRFYYGPFEWLWRSLTHMKAQPFRKK